MNSILTNSSIHLVLTLNKRVIYIKLFKLYTKKTESVGSKSFCGSHISQGCRAIFFLAKSLGFYPTADTKHPSSYQPRHHIVVLWLTRIYGCVVSNNSGVLFWELKRSKKKKKSKKQMSKWSMSWKKERKKERNVPI